MSTPPPNPYTARVSIKVNGADEIINIPPNHLVSFSYTQLAHERGVGTYEIVIFDREFFILEEKLMKAKNIEIQWGYWGGQMSEAKTASVVEYNIVSIHPGLGVIMRLNVTDYGFLFAKNSKTRIWKELKIHEVVASIGSELGLEYCPGDVANGDLDDQGRLAVTIQDCVDYFDVAYGTTNVFVQRDMSDLDFMTNVLAPKAVTSKGVKGFRVYIENGKRLHFSPHPDLIKKGVLQGPVRRKFVYPEPNGEVISFIPSLRIGLLDRLRPTRSFSIERDSGSVLVIKRDIQTMEGKTIHPQLTSHVEDVQSEIIDAINNGDRDLDPVLPSQWDARQLREVENSVNNISSGDIDLAAAYVQSRWSAVTRGMYDATLNLLGDPTMTAGSIVEVDFMVGVDPEGRQAPIRHFTSGKYMIDEVNHVINQDGRYETTCQMYAIPTPVTRGKESTAV